MEGALMTARSGLEPSPLLPATRSLGALVFSRVLLGVAATAAGRHLPRDLLFIGAIGYGDK
jgi:hypothetical protein